MADPILEKKMGAYKFCEEDFVAPGEITVTITLTEYRDLVTTSATAKAKIDEAQKDKYTREAENKALKEENAALKDELYELQKKMDSQSTGEEGL